MDKRWVVMGQGDKDVVEALAKALNINYYLSNLLIQRDIKTFDEAKAFFRPEIAHLHDPFLMKDMDLAVDRLYNAIHNNEKILVYGDYDVDGTTAVALVYTFIKSIYSPVDFYIPNRYSEGYGISYVGIDYAHEKGISLIIALDCGIKAIEKVAYAKEKGIDFIIGDHHRPGDALPDAVAVLDAKRSDCNYPYRELSGCGVGFKLVQAYAEKNNMPFDHLKSYFDLVVVSIASDIVPIAGENRVLAYYGLKQLNNKPRPGFEAILQFSNIRKNTTQTLDNKKNNLFFNRELTISDLVFLIGPRINAAGRMESGRNSVQLLISENMKEAVEQGNTINKYNTERRSLDTNITQDAIEMIESNEELKNARSTIVYDPNWHKGVIGIVASRLTEHFYRPTIVLTRSNGLITGSARSIKNFDIYDAIDECSDLLEHFGGHTYAAGLSLKEENFDEFRQRFEAITANIVTDLMMIPEVEIDAEITLNNINSKFLRILKQFAPFGPGNMAPVFRTNNVVDTGSARLVGNNHLKLSLIHPDITGFPIDAIAFQQGDKLPLLKNGKSVDVCYHIEENEWNGNVSIQLNIKDIKASS